MEATGVFGGGVSTYSISGIVYDADGTTPVPGATVTLGALSAVSIANGTYTISNVPPGASGSMTCTLTGYSWTAITVAAMSGNLTAQNYTNAWWAGGGAGSIVYQAQQPEGAASYAASKVNLPNPGTHDVTDGDTPAWDATNGWILTAGENHYLITDFIPDANKSAVIKFSGVAAPDDAYLFGSYTGVGMSFQIIPKLATNKVRYGNGGASDKTPALLEGVLIIAGNKCYRNGVDDGITLTDWSGVSTHVVHIGRLNRASPTGYITANIKAFALYDGVLTPAQALIINDAIESPFEPTPAGAGEIMIVHVTDTHYQDAATALIHSQMAEWIADHAAELGVDIVLHSGDVIYPPLDQAAQYLSADTLFDNLDAANIPYMVTAGNHDYDGDNATDVIGRESIGFNAAFPQARYTTRDWWDGGFFEAGRTENAYLLMTIDSVDWIFVSMEFGPRDDVLTWVNGLLTTYSARHAVIITHSHIHRDGTTVAAGDQYAPHPDYTLDALQNNGDEVLAALIGHDNIRLILSGHDKGTIGWCTANRADNSSGGVPINQMVANYQSMYAYGSGMMRFVRINPTAKTIQVQTFSPRLNMFMHDAANEFTVDWEP
jgi:hypothetical protein